MDIILRCIFTVSGCTCGYNSTLYFHGVWLYLCIEFYVVFSRCLAVPVHRILRCIFTVSGCTCGYNSTLYFHGVWLYLSLCLAVPVDKTVCCIFPVSGCSACTCVNVPRRTSPTQRPVVETARYVHRRVSVRTTTTTTTTTTTRTSDDDVIADNNLLRQNDNYSDDELKKKVMSNELSLLN